jgi:putative glutamine amidotransferase
MTKETVMSKKPVIGITVDHNDPPAGQTLPNKHVSPHAYTLAVEKAGGVPLLIPYMASIENVPAIVDVLDGIIFSGGNDLDPTPYGQELHPKAEPIDPRREAFERALLAEVEKRNLPTLGICLGSQLMNVTRGGTLHQFLPDLSAEQEHRKLDVDERLHEARVDDHTKLAEVLEKTAMEINSSHKQAVKTVGRGLKVTAYGADGVIEATEDPSKPFYIGVQWHPERIVDRPEQLLLFKKLVDAAR